MARLSQPRQPRYSTGRSRKVTNRRLTGSVGPTPARRRGPAPILIIAAVIVLLVMCWIFGRGCGSNQEAHENEQLSAYASKVNKMITRSAAVGAQFETLRNSIKDQARDDVSRKLDQMIATSRGIAADSSKVVIPKKAEGLQPLLQLSLDMRIGGIDKYRTAILDVLDKKDNIDASTSTMSQGLLDLVVSDATLQRFRENLAAKLKDAKLGFDKVADSVYVPKTDEALTSAVSTYIRSLTGTSTGNELHGVAVAGLTTSPARVDRTSSGVSVLPYSKTFTVKVAVQNQGNQTEENVPVEVTLTADTGGTPQKKTQKIASLKPGETASLVFEDITPTTGTNTVNILTVKAGPVPNEKKVDNNEMQLKFIMRPETG
jgi:CARDB